MNEAEALPLSRSLRSGPQESALEEGWLLAEMEQRFGYSLDELARRFDRSTSWVSRRLALVELLPEAIQQQVRVGKLGAQVAMKYLVPVARAWLNAMALSMRLCKSSTLQERRRASAATTRSATAVCSSFMRAKIPSFKLRREHRIPGGA
jgi:hypothetical protein